MGKKLKELRKLYNKELEILDAQFGDLIEQIISANKSIKELREAAEFEARVAATLAIWQSEGVVMECDMCEYRKQCVRLECAPNFCRWVFLRDARIAVEEEMDGR